MTMDLVSPTEADLQLIQDRRTVGYVGVSTMIMFICDYGGLTNNISNRMAPLVFGSIGPVIMLDKEVSPVPLFRIDDAQYITLYTRLNISG